MRRLFAGAVCLLALCGCNSTPQNPVDAASQPGTKPAKPVRPAVSRRASGLTPRRRVPSRFAGICDGAQN